MNQRRRILVEPDAQVAIRLKANPGQWYAVAEGDKSRRHTLSQTAYRIRKGLRVAFRCETGSFETMFSKQGMPPGEVELLVRYAPIERDEAV